MSTEAIRPRSPASHRGDPETSFQAEQIVNSAGVRDSQAAAVFAEARRRDGRTSAEIAHDSGLDRHAVARRLSDLEKLGLVKKSENRPCRIGRRLAVTWFLVNPDDRQQRTLFS